MNTGIDISQVFDNWEKDLAKKNFQVKHSGLPQV